MPRPKPWVAQIPNLLKTLRESDQQEYTRSNVEELFGIGPSAALDLMHTAGAKLAGGRVDGALVVSRDSLIHYLTYGPEAHAAEVEARRRAKLATQLNAAAADQRLRNIKLMEASEAKEWLLRDLANVSIDDGVCRVVFDDATDLMRQLYKLVQAAGAHWDEFEKMCAPPAAAKEQEKAS